MLSLLLCSDGEDFYGEIFVLAITVDPFSDHGTTLYQWYHPQPRGDVSPQLGGRCHSMSNFGGALSEAVVLPTTESVEMLLFEYARSHN